MIVVLYSNCEYDLTNEKLSNRQVVFYLIPIIYKHILSIARFHSKYHNLVFDQNLPWSFRSIQSICWLQSLQKGSMDSPLFLDDVGQLLQFYIYMYVLRRYRWYRWLPGTNIKSMRLFVKQTGVLIIPFLSCPNPNPLSSIHVWVLQ